MTDQRRASLYLIGATLFWGLSFPLTRALAVAQQANLPLASTWFLTALTVAVRFGVAGVVMLGLALRGGMRPTRSEWVQGLGLAFFASGGLIFQNDGLFRTTASVSAFLTQSYCAILPLYTAVRLRKWPRAVEIFALGLVIAGVAILSGVRWGDLHLGRGEIETLVCSVFFAGQILWLERAEFQSNRPVVFSTIMFLAIAAAMSGVTGLTMAQASDFFQAFHGWPSWFLVAALTVGCTLVTFTAMNRWQPHVSATDAGLIYCLEPVFAAVFALFLPGALAIWMELDLENELFTSALVLGGAAILLANLAVLLAPKSRLEVP
ncbi:MAG: DMT family transporter [Chthoniobacterales bacterium]